MDIGPAAQSYTILRIKRKRNEEPLDALVVESSVRRKKSRGGIGIFQFAQTLERDEWENEQRRKDLQEQISMLARATAAKTATESPAASSSADPAPSSPTRQRALSSVDRYPVGHPNQSSPVVKTKDSARQQSKDELAASARRYTIIHNMNDGVDRSENAKKKAPTSPPKVISARDTIKPRTETDFKMFDAILDDDNGAADSKAKDEEMEKFMPMLADYLKMHDISPPASPKRPSAFTGASRTKENADDYVWDVFYHRPATLTEWNVAANVGTLTGLPPSITDPYDSDSDDEAEDEADEDSNEEAYYKNDYPDEDDPSDEAGSSDEFHESSEDEQIYDDDDVGGRAWR